jgi:Clp amino terminal domain, pathogenicity island component
MALVSPNPACYRVFGRADEIARMMNSPHVRAEHLFLALIHDDKGMPARELAGLVDLNVVEAAVIEAVGKSAGQSPERPSPPELTGIRVVAEMGDSYVGTWHVFLALIRDRESLPARVLASLVDLSQVETAVIDAMNSPGFRGFKDSFSADELLFPAGLELDQALISTISRSLPEGATFGFNWREDDGRAWISVTPPGNPRDALNTALISLGRPPLP